MPNASASIPAKASRLTKADLVAAFFIFILGSLVRLLFLHQVRACPLFDYLVVDARAYYDWSDAIVAGNWVGDRVFYQAPLYPYCLALIKLVVGSDLSTIRIVQAILGSVTCALLYLAGRLLWSRAVGLAAGVMLALYPPAIFFDAIIQKAGLGSFFTALLLVVLASQLRRSAIWKAVILGVVLGLLMLTREEALLLAPVLATWLWLRGGRHANHGEKSNPIPGRTALLCAFLAGLFALLAPVAARNYHVGGEYVLTTTQAGPNFFIGNNSNATGVYAPLRPGRSDTRLERIDAVEIAEQASGRKLSASEVSRYWLDRALVDIRKSPGAWLALVGRKLMLLLNAYEIPDAENQYVYEEYALGFRLLSRVLHWGSIVSLAAAGFILALRRSLPMGILIAVIVTLAAGVVIFYVFGRYRFNLVLPLMLLAGLALVHGFNALRAHDWRSAAPAVMAALFIGVPANWPIFSRRQHFAESYSNAGAAAATAGDDRRAVTLFEKSLDLAPALPDTLCNLAMSKARLGRLGEALPLLRRARELRPGDPRIEMMMGTALAEAGQLEDAARHLEIAVLLGPGDVDARVNYQAVLAQLGRWKQAVEQASAIVSMRPDDPVVLGELAWLLAACADPSLRDGPAAVQAAEKAVKITGQNDAELIDILACAYAQANRFDAAIAAATQARQLAASQSQMALLERIDAHLRLFREKRAILPFGR